MSRLLTIQEPLSEIYRHVPVMGIDLGTTHSLVAVYQNGTVSVLPDEKGGYLLPSVVHYFTPTEVSVGCKAIDAFETDPDNTLLSVKRDLTTQRVWLTRAGKRNAIEASSEILKALVVRARGIHPAAHQAVITVPAYFDEAQRQATKRAAEKAGIDVWRLLNEPTAAAVAYGINKKATGTCLVFDLGGGTFDVSILHLQKGVFEVLATGGDPALGGDDIDTLVMQATLLPRLQARALKEALSFQNSVEGMDFTRCDLDACLTPLLNKMLTICKKVLQDAKRTIADLDEVILVGGSTRIPLLQQAIETFFQKKPLCHIDPDQVVAIGAAIQASILSGQYQGEEVLLLDVTPLSLGVEMMGEVVEKMILRNTPIPAVATQTFTTYADGQTGLSLHVVQGERETVEHCRSLARFDLTGIPPMPAGKARIEVTFRIDADGLLCVEALEATSGITSQVTVNSLYGLTSQEIETDVEEALLRHEEDRRARQLAAEKQLKEAVERALSS